MDGAAALALQTSSQVSQSQGPSEGRFALLRSSVGWTGLGWLAALGCVALTRYLFASPKQDETNQPANQQESVFSPPPQPDYSLRSGLQYTNCSPQGWFRPVFANCQLTLFPEAGCCLAAWLLYALSRPPGLFTCADRVFPFPPSTTVNNSPSERTSE